jgi:endonuclease/exonuclease/phosphatase family metal-dependent hydrolase
MKAVVSEHKLREDDKGLHMRFLLYNICYATHGNLLKLPLIGYLGRTQNHLSEIIEFIQPLDPDVVGLIEVDNGSYRTGQKCQAETIAEALGHFHCYRSKYGRTSRLHRLPLFKQQGNAFLAKDMICEERFHYFERGVKRLIIELELEFVTFFLVHLALGYKARQVQINHLYHLIKETNRPYILAGDFNAFLGEKEIQLLLVASKLRNADILGRPTYPSHRPHRHLDFILHSPEIAITQFWLPDVHLSDHLPLICDFELKDSKESSPRERAR